MTTIWTADDVLFAPVRASHGNPREIARDLLAAADAPGRLDGVTPTQATICAAEILRNAGDTDAALRVATEVLAAAASSDLGVRQRIALAQIFAAAGDADRAVDLAAEALTGEVTYESFGSRIELVLRLAQAGRFEQALRLCDAPVQRTTQRALGSRIGKILELTRQQVLAIQAEAGAAGTDLSLGRPAPSADSARADAAEPPAWPAVVGGRLGWWPEAEYVRIIRQVPELARVLGDPWRHHTSRVEAALRASSRGGERHIKLADVQFPEFVNYLVSTHADTVDAKVLTNFAPTTFARQTWPPKARAQCWCGSGSRYRDCCGRYR